MTKKIDKAGAKQQVVWTRWQMPKWMERYAPEIVNTGGNDVWELMDDDSLVQINAPRAMLAVAVKSQVALLEKLYRKGMLC